MVKYSVEQIRNVVFCGHKSSGKTTLIDRMLTHTGAVSRPPPSTTARASATSTRRRRPTATPSSRAWSTSIMRASGSM